MIDLSVIAAATSSDRVSSIRNLIDSVWQLEDVYGSRPYSQLVIKWRQYLALKKESVKIYRDLKNLMTTVFGYEVTNWIVDKTTFLIRNDVLIKKHNKADWFSDSVIDMINNN